MRQFATNMFCEVEFLKCHISYAQEPHADTNRHTRRRRRRRGKILIFKRCGFHSLEILVAPVCVNVCGLSAWASAYDFHARQWSFCVCVIVRVCLLMCACFLMWFCSTEKQAFKFYRENPQIPQWIDNYKQDKTYMCVYVFMSQGLKPNMFYEFRRKNNYKFLPQLKRGKQAKRIQIVRDLTRVTKWINI